MDIAADPNYDGGKPIRWLRISDKPPRAPAPVSDERRVNTEPVKSALRRGLSTRVAAAECGVGRDTVRSIRHEMVDNGEL